MQWSDTRLWKCIGQLTDTEKSTVSRVLDAATTVLRSGGTAPLDFTLHDDLHGFRVAERIADLVGPNLDEVLTAHEIALALLSAYTHDIGMSPSRNIVKKHYNFIITGDRSLMTSQEVGDLQKWLDAEWDGFQPPVKDGSITADGLNLAEKITSYYCRHRHNDWSEIWIRETLSDVSPSLYPNWTDDLVTICRSHHEGLAALRSDRFEARITGSRGGVVNLRFLAALLRVADVLEFDPERTPEIILTHREIAPSSRKYWQQDHEISFHLDGDAERILLSARTPNAVLHRAVLDVAGMVNHELASCAALEHEGSFRLGKIPEADRNRYRWRWPSQVVADIQEKDQSFVYIDGAFRPDVKKVINLLSGTALYGSPMAAIRELIQNAVDAVREQIAYERLGEDIPGTSDFSETWSKIHRIRMFLEGDSSEIWLRCSDDGVGMTKDIIEHHLLVSGSGVRADLRALERDSESKGFSVGRTGQFGIGTLSYFMISDYLEITTRRSAEAGDSDHCGWKFATQGLGAFGELLRASRSAKGTDIRLRLRRDLFVDDERIFQNICNYINSVVNFLPCRIEVRDEIFAREAVVFEPGWRDGRRDFENALAGKFEDRKFREQNVSNERKEFVREVRKKWLRAEADALEKLRWFGPREYELPNKRGRVRLWLPYFELEGGCSIAYMQLEDGKVTSLPDGNDIVVPDSFVSVSWRGFRTAPQRTKFGNHGVVEIDLLSGAEISVDRLHLNSIDESVYAEVSVKLREMTEEFLVETANQSFWMLNEAVTQFEPAKDFPQKRFHWITPSEAGKEWSEVKAPFVEICTYSFARDVSGSVKMGTISLSIMQKIRHQSSYIGISTRLPGGNLRFCNKGTQYNVTLPSIVWLDGEQDAIRGFSCKFPRSLKDVVSVKASLRNIVNADHPYIAQISEDIGFKTEINLFNINEECEILSIRGAVVQCINEGLEFWNSLRDNRPIIYQRILDDLRKSDIVLRAINLSGDGISNSEMICVDSSGVRTFPQGHRINSLIGENDFEIKLVDDVSDWLSIEDNGKYSDDD